MNIKIILTLYSFRNELKIFLITFLMVFVVLPVLIFTVLTQVGIQAVSDILAKLNPVSGVVTLFNPNTQSVYKEVEGPFYWPLAGVVTTEFGGFTVFQPFHPGIDIAAAKETPVTVFMPGRVSYTGELSWGYGRHIIIDHGDNITSIYAHLDKIHVEVGDEVNPGEVIGSEGSTGWSTGPHLHFETRVFWVPVDPRTFLGTGTPS